MPTNTGRPVVDSASSLMRTLPRPSGTPAVSSIDAVSDTRADVDVARVPRSVETSPSVPTTAQSAPPAMAITVPSRAAIVPSAIATRWPVERRDPPARGETKTGAGAGVEAGVGAEGADMGRPYARPARASSVERTSAVGDVPYGCAMTDEVPTIFEWAGGRPALGRGSDPFYARGEHDDELGPLLGGRVTDEHRRNVVTWWCEVMGGPADYTASEGGYEHMLAKHLGLAITAAQRLRFVTLLSQAADDAELPDDPEFRA